MVKCSKDPQWPCRDLQWWHVSHFRFKQKSEIRNPISCYYTPRYFGYQVKHDRDSGRNPWYFCKKSYFYALRNPFIYRIGRVLRCPSLEARAQRLKARSWRYFRRCKTSADPNPSYKGSFLKSCTSYKSKRVEMKARKNGISGFYFCKESLLSQIKKLFHSFTRLGLQVVDICRSHLYMNQLYYD